MNILCLMGLFPKEYRGTIEKNSKGGIQYAADKLQHAIVEGLDSVDGVNVSIINSLYIGSYPKRYRRMKIPTFKFKHSESCNGINVGFCNLTGIKGVSRYSSIKKVIKKWAKTEGEKSLLIYALTTPFCNIAQYVKNKFPNIKVCIVVPDLPEYMNPYAMENNCVYRILKKMQIKSIKKCIKKVDAYVLLTDAMKEWFDNKITYTVVEGIASGANSCKYEVVQKEKNILYAGGIKREYGIIDLANAFAMINNPDWKLVVFGTGDAINELKTIALKCPNIIIRGVVPNQVVIEEQRKATVLVNPRKNQIFTKYSFPSKILEYMSSGTPMLAYKLDGIPSEYDEYFFHIRDEEDGMKNALETVMNLSDEERNAMGYKAKEFVIEHKNAKKQCEKIVNLLTEVDSF